MNDLPSASLIIERRIRGHLPVTRFSVSEVGSVMVAVPDQHQSRLYRLGRLAHTGDWQEIADFSVETLTAWDIASSGEAFVAATNDDLYLFVGGRKKRLLTDRRDVYVAASITAAGDAIAVASSDMLMSAYAVTLLSADGKELWTMDLPVTLTCAQISPDGSMIAAGSEEGLVYLIGSDRHMIWQFDAEEPVAEVCAPSADQRVIVGMRSGKVAVLEDGAKLWESEGNGPVVACAGAEDGIVVIARDAGEDEHTVECLARDGSPLTAYSAPSALTSVACSHDGRYVALSCRDGSLHVMEVQGRPSRLMDAQEGTALYENAVSMANRGDYTDAVPALIRSLELDPRNVDASRKLAETAHSLVRESLRLAEESLVNGDYAESAHRLHVAWENCVYAPETASNVLAMRERVVDSMLGRARELSDSSAEEALDLLNVLLQVDLANTEARELLGRLEDEITDRLVREAEEALSSGRPSDAVRLLEQARDRSSSDRIGETLAKARCEEALAEGLALYEARQYPQAILRFRKVLSIDPQNAEALRHIEYAEKIGQDDALFDRFSKLE